MTNTPMRLVSLQLRVLILLLPQEHEPHIGDHGEQDAVLPKKRSPVHPRTVHGQERPYKLSYYPRLDSFDYCWCSCGAWPASSFLVLNTGDFKCVPCWLKLTDNVVRLWCVPEASNLEKRASADVHPECVAGAFPEDVFFEHSRRSPGSHCDDEYPDEVGEPSAACTDPSASSRTHEPHIGDHGEQDAVLPKKRSPVHPRTVLGQERPYKYVYCDDEYPDEVGEPSAACTDPSASSITHEPHIGDHGEQDAVFPMKRSPVHPRTVHGLERPYKHVSEIIVGGFDPHPPSIKERPQCATGSVAARTLTRKVVGVDAEFYLTELHVSRAIALLEEGRTMRYVGNDLGVAPSFIYRLWKRYRETGEYSRRRGQGRKRKTTRLQDRYIVNCALQISEQTVRNRLLEANLRSRRPVRAVRLTIQHRQARRQFAQNHANWQLRHWRPVLFTDESRFRLTRCDGRLRVYRRPGERYSAAAVQEYDKFGCGSVMVWGGVSLDERTDLVVVPGRLCPQTYIENVLEDHVWPAAYGMGPDFLLMQDNARPHTAAITSDYLRQQEIRVMEWPSMSRDLNPIEHIWDLLDRRTRKRPIAPQTLQQLTEALIEERERIPQEDIRRIIRSMPRRCQAVIRAHGGHTLLKVTKDEYSNDGMVWYGLWTRFPHLDAH
ncbi:unnamed protein product [Pieris macdunnoughi]|uniref:Transposase n=1 Tax=Pieris macdunnoughi TaxID=345717 RepID=A0A821TB72_9NEOP|nr:unnamed protein product [Pieris macdunnoughi]